MHKICATKVSHLNRYERYLVVRFLVAFLHVQAAATCACCFMFRYQEVRSIACSRLRHEQLRGMAAYGCKLAIERDPVNVASQGPIPALHMGQHGHAFTSRQTIPPTCFQSELLLPCQGVQAALVFPCSQRKWSCRNVIDEKLRSCSLKCAWGPRCCSLCVQRALCIL